MTPEEAVAYLSSRNLLDPARVVACGLEIRDASRRNANLLMAYGDGTGLFLKQPSPGDSSRPLAIEAGFYQRVSSDARLAPLAPFVPALRHHDRAESLLVLELRGGVSLAGLHRQGETPAIGPDLAAALAACHRAPGHREADGCWSEPFASASPALWDPTPGPSFLRDAGPAQLEIARLIQERAEIQELLERIPELWEPARLIHGDLRWDNILVTEAADPPGGGLTIVDWEAAGIGDPAWDLGCVWFGFLAACVEVASGSADDPSAIADRFGDGTRRVQSDVQAFWRSYLREAAIDPVQESRLRERATLCCGARLVEHAMELAAGVPVMPAQAVLALQLAFNVLTRPLEAPAVLFGIGPGSALQ